MVVDLGEHGGGERHSSRLATLRRGEHHHALDGLDLPLNMDGHRVPIDVVRGVPENFPLPQAQPRAQRNSDPEPLGEPFPHLVHSLLRPHDDLRAFTDRPSNRLGMTGVLSNQPVVDR
ncbi:MAG TPA: hypothetical protein VFG15_14150 [Amycolatopsis sp.]|nr:hypothetical protein [Amycolatopsis sp.]